jgi:uncharacterized protein
MLKRFCNLPEKQSFFLFGPRATGKSTLLKSRWAETEALFIDLLNPSVVEVFFSRPQALGELLEGALGKFQTIVIDEVQRAPQLLDIVQQYMQEKKFQFALTGSSARKLKRGAANLLGGRAIVKHLGPLSVLEIETPPEFGKPNCTYQNEFITQQLMNFGALPLVFFEPHKETKLNLLRAYSQTYLNEEIVAEQLIRNLTPFRKFLQVAAMSNGSIVNFQKLALASGCSHVTIQSYYEILEDTLIGFSLPAYHSSLRKRLRTKPKFYFFDVGVWRGLARNLEAEILPSTSVFGKVFEHLVIAEIKTLASYFKPDWTLSYLQTQAGAEIDLVIDTGVSEPILIEIKSAENLGLVNVSQSAGLMGEFPKSKKYFFSRDSIARKTEAGVMCLHWIDGLRELFQ